MLVINNDACISIANIKCSSLTKRNKKNKKKKKKKERKKDGGQHMWYSDKMIILKAIMMTIIKIKQ